MGIRVRKHKGSWWVFVTYHGRRKAKKVGSERAARQVAAKLEVALACGDFSCLDSEAQDLVFAAYAKKVLEFKVLRCKQSTVDCYRENQQRYVLPVFGERKLRSIKRDDIKTFLADLTKQNLALNTIKLALAALRVVLSCAVEDKLIAANPALRLGSFTESEKPAHRAQAMEPEEAQRFLQAACDYCPDDYYPLFLIALRAGLRQGEILGLKWGDFQFGQSEDDLNRYIFVQRRWYRGRQGMGTYSNPKNRKERRVDMSQELRRVLVELRDRRLLQAFAKGRESIAEDLVFPGQDGRPITIRRLEGLHQTCLENAGLRRFRFQDLRHTFGSLLLDSGAPLPYVSEQMGHASIRVTADIYIHLIRSGNIQWVDKLDTAQPETQPEMQPNATQLQPKKRG